MPLSLDPNAVAEVWLPSDEHIPMESRPVFLARFITKREYGEVRRLMQAAFDEADPVKCESLLYQALGIGLKGWRNQRRPADGSDPGEFAIDKIGDVLTAGEIWVLGWQYPDRIRLAETDRKKLPPPSPPDGGNSAPSATAANATMSQPASAQPCLNVPNATGPKTTAAPVAAGG